MRNRKANKKRAQARDKNKECAVGIICNNETVHTTSRKKEEGHCPFKPQPISPGAVIPAKCLSAPLSKWLSLGRKAAFQRERITANRSESIKGATITTGCPLDGLPAAPVPSLFMFVYLRLCNDRMLDINRGVNI